MTEKYGNAGALGLSAFGVTTLCMMLLNTKMIVEDGAGPGMAMVLGIGLFYGGLVQVLVGWQEWKTGNTFGAVAFTSYGAFWLSFCAIQLYKFTYAITDTKAMGIYMLAWTLFTVLMFIATLRLVLSLAFCLKARDRRQDSRKETRERKQLMIPRRQCVQNWMRFLQTAVRMVNRLIWLPEVIWSFPFPC